ncbi:NAD(P)-dependent oxidoreductase [Thermosphaera chiliense]|uniref:NAD(P)-dependent oxidoreductase n=1 Tax=Thermosphaera chiliense TaxID=3402707 RepID=A0A7M1UUA4_9CREN|nr:NAD(P)-dependent oxidoreductase [Thermosphaera aggregans]QOR94972.1 NAD(P)-dependent oxidoreductase [Thermosphaera aggregans]
MIVGIIGTGNMGSSLAECLTGRNVEVALFNRTRSKAEELGRRLGARVYDSPSELVENVEAAIAFVRDDQALRTVLFSIASKSGKIAGKVFINASTVTPSTSLEAMEILGLKGIDYVEAPVFGSTSEARECRLISMVSTKEYLLEKATNVLKLYSERIHYIGEPPKAMVVKLALNNLALALPAVLAESIMLLTSWDIELDVLRRVSQNTWIEPVLNRYWDRALGDSRPRFTVDNAGKDYSYVASALKYKGLPSFLSDAVSSMYHLAGRNGLGDRDYPQIVKYYREIAGRSQSSAG